jgi:hypothetical protein
MPWSIRKSGSGYKVVNKDTGKTYSKKPMTKEKAKKQLAALHINYNEEKTFERALNEALDNEERKAILRSELERAHSMVGELLDSDYLEIESMIGSVVEHLRHIGLIDEAKYLLGAKMPKPLLDYLSNKNDHFGDQSTVGPRDQMKASFTFKRDLQLQRKYNMFVEKQIQILSVLFKELKKKIKALDS